MVRKSRKRRRIRTKKKFGRKGIAMILSVFPYFLSVGLLALLFGASYAYAVQGDLFLLNDVSVTNGRFIGQDDAFRFTGLNRGENLLQLDLKGVERRIQRLNPHYQDVRVQRILPNQIQVTLRRREPVAQIRSDQYYLVDAEGVIVSHGRNLRDPQITYIQGTRSYNNLFVLGTKLDRRVAGHALRLIGELSQISELESHRVTVLDVTDPHHYVIWLDNRIEIRILSRNSGAQLKKLGDALKGIELDPDKIRYLDLRFDDVVIGPR